jgi:hypothetical protein
VTEMVENAKEITYKTFRRNVEVDRADWDLGDGFNMLTDRYVSYYKSKYNGSPCYFFEHGRIEYIFI